MHKCSTHCTTKDQDGRQYIDCPEKHDKELNLSQQNRQQPMFDRFLGITIDFKMKKYNKEFNLSHSESISLHTSE